MTDESATDKSRRPPDAQGSRLPHRPPARVWGGPGSGVRCAICNKTLRRDEIEYELEYDADGEGAAAASYHVHIACFVSWERERETSEGRDGAAAAPGSPAPGSTAAVSAPDAGGEAPGATSHGPSSSRVLQQSGADGTIAGCERTTDRRERA